MTMTESAIRQHHECTTQIFRIGLAIISLIMVSASVWGQTDMDTVRSTEEPATHGFIELRETLIPGWYYRVDSSEWQTVGVKAESLRDALYDDKELTMFMDEYQAGVTAARASYILSGMSLLASGGSGLASSDKEWTLGFLIASGSLLVVGLILDGDAGGKLKRAVEFHNRRRQRELDRKALGFDDRADPLRHRFADSPGARAGVILLRF